MGIAGSNNRAVCIDKISDVNFPMKCGIWNQHDVVKKKKVDFGGFPGGLDGKETIYNAGDPGSIPGLGGSPGEGNGNPLQYPCRENPHGQTSLVGYSPWGCKEFDTTEQLTLQGQKDPNVESLVQLPLPKPSEPQIRLSKLHFLYLKNADDILGWCHGEKEIPYIVMDRALSRYDSCLSCDCLSSCSEIVS